jgi:hypothetical protein
MVLIGVGRPMSVENILTRARLASPPLKDIKFKCAFDRLQRDGVIREVGPGLFDISEPGEWEARVGAKLLAKLDAARAFVESCDDKGVEMSDVPHQVGPPARRAASHDDEADASRSPHRTSSEVAIEDVARRAAVVFGPAIGDQLLCKGQSIERQVKGRLDLVLDAIDYCAETEFQPRNPIAFVSWLAKKNGAEGVPDRFGPRQTPPAQPIGRAP